jgi:hypothetical protein
MKQCGKLVQFCYVSILNKEVIFVDLKVRDKYMVGRDSIIGLVTRYRVDGPGIKSRLGEIIRTHQERP